MKFAKLNYNSKVISVVEINNSDCQDADGNISEVIGIQFLDNLTKYPNWVMIKDNHLGGNVGDTYLADEDVFKPKKPFASWTWDIANKKWQPPVQPTGNQEVWNEDSQSWLAWNAETNTWA